ncbi:putative O-phosphotransferase [Streptomyces spongiicola]|uniref:Putative O-phosphotransferase n=1 Tax=Streptomyces spongiicola TaxID=1690221 RepID=A0A388SSI7_9ACTN|nr:AAA family ATPase [Streptomyces spongiicola]GBP99597.1 putative O-phosphotransferase [Streptomyces spongiicola]
MPESPRRTAPDGPRPSTVPGEPPGESPAGKIIFLNGTSSSGKSSIAAELLRILDEPWFHMPVDAFHAMRSAGEVAPEELPLVLRRTWQGFHRAVAGMAAAGNNVVVDHVLSEEWRLRDCLRLFEPRNVVLVGVRCSVEELRRRELARGDRPAGLAARQLRQVHAYGPYDVECDTTTASSTDCARRIRSFLTRRPFPTAFERLRAEAAPGGRPTGDRPQPSGP